jgi:DnaK suppressor protein
MNVDEARELLAAERTRVEALLAETRVAAVADRVAVNEDGRMSDPGLLLVCEETDDAVVDGLRRRLDAIRRAEERLAAGTYGRSVRSGQDIPDDRLRADPTAELTVDEARASR